MNTNKADAKSKGTLYTVELPNGQVSTRTSKRTYTHAVVVHHNPAAVLASHAEIAEICANSENREWAETRVIENDEQRDQQLGDYAWGALSFQGRRDLAEKAAKDARTWTYRGVPCWDAVEIVEF